jgi:hypothetical protein
MDRSDVPIFLAIVREGTLGGASRKLGQAQPTMGRRLRGSRKGCRIASFPVSFIVMNMSWTSD